MSTLPGQEATQIQDLALGYAEHRRTTRAIIRAYDSAGARLYARARFSIIGVNILNIIRLCLRGKTNVLEVGCGYGLFGLYLALRDSESCYLGIDLDEHRIDAAQRAAKRLGLTNVRFEVGDARDLDVTGGYDAIMLMDLAHHLRDDHKQKLFSTVLDHMEENGHLVIKDLTRRPKWKLILTRLHDIVMTRSFDMWYWDPSQYREVVDRSFKMEIFPVADLRPYSHVIYLFSRP